MKLNNTLKKYRKKYNWSQGDIAKILKLKSAQYISNIERGVCAPSYSVIKVYMEQFDISKEEIQTIMVKDLVKTINKEL